MSELPRLGFVGLGIMGYPMSGHLAKAGYPLAVFDTDPAMVQRVCELRADIVAAASAAAVGATSDIVITMLPDGNVVRDVALGEHGLIDGMAPGSLLLDTSSSQPWLTMATAEALSERGIGMVDAPVSGAQWGAEQADLVFMVGGTPADVARVRPLLDVLGRSIHHCGPLSSGHIMKCINNTITAMTLLGTAEGLALGSRAGLDPVAMVDVLNDSTGGSWISRNHVPQRILTRTFDDPFRLELMAKDVRIAVELARGLDVSVPFADQCARAYDAAHALAGPGRSLSELVRWVEQYTGVEIMPGGDAEHHI